MLDSLQADPSLLLDNVAIMASLGERLISANDYLGASGIVDPLRADADVVIKAMVADQTFFQSLKH
ncbi:acyclic terpene utilization AtuA family protein, partial [Pseudomonas sp. 5B4]